MWFQTSLLYKYKPNQTLIHSPSIHSLLTTPSLIQGANKFQLNYYPSYSILSNSELANQQIQPQIVTIEEENRNKLLVIKLYNALNKRDVETVHRLLTPDLEWRFHGPPHHQHMMNLLTGASPDNTFLFIPRSICVFGSVVLVEGTDVLTGSAYWVHAWTVGPQGVIIQVREYFNTSLTVTRVGDGTKESRPKSCLVWRSRLPDKARKSLPGLVLAI